MQSTISTRTLAMSLFVYGSAHALVDATCGAVVFTILATQGLGTWDQYYLVLTYNILAFGFQPFFGRLVDYWRVPRLSAVLGCALLAGSALILGLSPALAVILGGIGNALFHVGGGVVCLNLTPNRATAPGIYVAPGALGLMVGILLGKTGHFDAWPFIVLLSVASAAICTVAAPEIDYEREPAHPASGAFVITVLLLFTIAMRSFTGFAVPLPWKSDVWLLVLLTLAVSIGKALGGILGDRYGWITVAVGALVLSAPFLAFGAAVPALAITGMLLFNMTMAVTLAAVSCVFPGRSGFAFGLTCLAYILGVFPAISHVDHGLGSSVPLLLMILGSAAALLPALLMLRPYRGAQRPVAQLDSMHNRNKVA